MASEIIEATKQAMEKTIDAYERELGTIRTGLVWASFPVAELVSCAVALLLCRSVLHRRLDGLEA